MPIYDYKCDGCGATFEHVHAMGEDPAVTCPKCEKSARKLFTTGGVVGGGASRAGGMPAMPSSPCGSGACGMGGMCGL